MVQSCPRRGCCPSGGIQVRAPWYRVCPVWSQTPRSASSVVVPGPFKTPFFLVPGVPTSFRDCWVSWRPHRFCLRHGPQCGTNAHHPLVIATSTHWGGRWRDLYPLEPGCWGTPKAMECPEPQFPSFPALLGSGAQSPGQGGDSGRAL